MIEQQEFTNEKYEEMSESLFFNNKEIIDEAVKILYEHKANAELHQQMEYITVAAKRFYSKFDSFTFQQHIDQKTIAQFKELNFVLPIAELKHIIKENLREFSETKINEVNKPKEQIIILELGFQEFQEFQKLNQINEREKFILLKFRQQLSTEADNFWTFNEMLIKKYQNDFQQFYGSKDPTLFLLKGKPIRIKDYFQFLERDFYLENNKLVPTCINQFQGLIVNPVNECARLYCNLNILNCIQAIQQLKIQSKFYQINNSLTQYFKELSQFQAFQRLQELIDHSKQIVKWEQILQEFFQQYEDSKRLSIKDFKAKQNSNFIELRDYLNSYYSQLPENFRHQFYNFNDENQIEVFAQAPSFSINSTNMTSGHCAYEISSNGFLIYMKLAIEMEIGKDKNYQPLIIQKRFSSYSLLHYTMNYPLKENSELGQVILGDKDEGMKVFKFNYVLKEQYRDQIIIGLTKPQSNNEITNLIRDILLRVVAIKMKRILLNPSLREQMNYSQMIQEI